MSLSQSIWVQLKTSLELGSEQNKFEFSAWQKTLTNFPIELCEDMFINGELVTEKLLEETKRGIQEIYFKWIIRA